MYFCKTCENQELKTKIRIIASGLMIIMEMQLTRFLYIMATTSQPLTRTMTKPRNVAPVLHPMVEDGGFIGKLF